jgi:hypothetical protein
MGGREKKKLVANQNRAHRKIRPIPSLPYNIKQICEKEKKEKRKKEEKKKEKRKNLPTHSFLLTSLSANGKLIILRNIPTQNGRREQYVMI